MICCFSDDIDSHSVKACYSATPLFHLSCSNGKVINILYSEFGRSACADNCCPSPTDCIVPGEAKPGRLQNIKTQCQGEISCNIRADWLSPTNCSTQPMDYEVIYYSCVYGMYSKCMNRTLQLLNEFNMYHLALN